MKIRFLILLIPLLACLLLNSFCCCAYSFVFDLSELPAVSSIWNGEAVTEVFIPESEGGGPGGCVAIIVGETPPAKILYQYYYDMIEHTVKIEFVTNIKDEDQISCAQVVDAKIGDTFIGSSGRIYVLQEQKILSEEQLQYLAKNIRVVGEWAPVETSGSSTAD